MKRTECPSLFLQGYLDAALFTTDENPPSGQDYVTSGRSHEMFEALPGYFIEQAQKDCALFELKRAALLEQAGDASQNGNDFWYTRNRHGVGFWDRGYADEIGDALTKAAHAFGEHGLMPEDLSGS